MTSALSVDRRARRDVGRAARGASRQAAKIRRVFERMGGLYNKTAQSMASREGIVPHAWIQEVSPDRLYRLDRTEVVQYVV